MNSAFAYRATDKSLILRGRDSDDKPFHVRLTDTEALTLARELISAVVPS